MESWKNIWQKLALGQIAINDRSLCFKTEGDHVLKNISLPLTDKALSPEASIWSAG
jgi:hypothetical protein